MKINYYKLSDLCVDIIDCPHSTPIWKESGVRVVRNFNLKDGNLDFSNGFYVDESTYQDRIKRAMPEQDDIIISREAPMGVVAIIPKDLKCCLGQRLVLLKVDKSKIAPFYLLSILRSEYVQTQFRRADVTGSTVSNLCIPDLKNIIIPVVEINQSQNAKLLKNINEKIVVNSKINDNLVATAKASLLKLFIENDNIPKQQIGHFCFEVKAGGTPNRTMHSYWNNGLYPWVKNGEVKNNIIIDTEEFISQSGYENSSAKLVKKHSVLMAMYCVSTPQLAYTDIDVTTNQAVCAMTTRNKLQAAYLYYYLMFFGQDLINDANGSAQINLSKELISNYCIPIPDDAMLSNMNLIENLEYRTQVSKEIVALTSLSQLLIANLSR